MFFSIGDNHPPSSSRHPTLFNSNHAAQQATHKGLNKPLKAKHMFWPTLAFQWILSPFAKV